MGPDILDDSLAGIVPRACRFIFEHIARNPDHCEFKVTCSFLEIYKEVIKDLLNPKGVNLKVRETPTRGVWVEGLSETEVSSHMEVLRLLHQGEEHRAVASTNMNSVSSRSHSLFILTVSQKTRDGATKTGKLNLADLAGSEKVGKTGASGETLEEAKKINQSLSALGNCIMALTKKNKAHVPYRDSKLTFILRESLGGNTKTTLLIACSPHSFNLEETVSTLRFGQRAKSIKNKVKINAQRSVAELELIVKKLTKEVKVLKKYSTRLEQELNKLHVEGLDLEAIKRQLFEEAAAAGSTKLPMPEPTTPVQMRATSRLHSDSDSEDAEKLSDGGKSTPTKDYDDMNARRLDGSISLPSSPKRTRNGFSLATQVEASDSPMLLRSSSSRPNLRPGTPSRASTVSDIDLMSSPMSVGNTTPTRPTIFLDGILNDDETDAMLDAQLEYNRMKENLNLQIQDLTEDLAQAAEEKETLQQKHRIQLAKAAEENSLLQRELTELRERIAQLESEQTQSTSPSSPGSATTSTNSSQNSDSSTTNHQQKSVSPRPPQVPLLPIPEQTSTTNSTSASHGGTSNAAAAENTNSSSSNNKSTSSNASATAATATASASPVVPTVVKTTSPSVGGRRGSVSTQSPRGPISIPLDGSSPLRREAGDPVFMTRQMFHWMVLATKLEMFSQGHAMRYDADFDSIFRELIDSNVSTQTWPKKIMKALEPPVVPPPSPAGKAGTFASASSPHLNVSQAQASQGGHTAPTSPSAKTLAPGGGNSVPTAQSAPYLNTNAKEHELRDVRA